MSTSPADRRFVYVTTAGCAVCREKSPLVDAMAKDFGIPLERVDGDTPEGGERAKALRIRGVPTLALVQGERIPFRLLGRMITRENVEHFFAREQAAG